ncbi:MAG TPA: RNA polymerase sigma factor, partial [Terriglobia bacterium]|nr:RNA polymerase sigma factor [Terriglobia bacterium]
GDKQPMKSDEQLMQEFQQGSTKAFEELFDRFRNSIHGFFRRRLNHAARAEELAQETFLIILRGIERYEARAKFRTYIFGIAIKQLWSERRKELREAKMTAEPFEERVANDPATSLWIRGALSQMDAEHREVLMLREYEQLSYEDISEILSIPLNTVRSRLSRARTEMRALLEEQYVRKVSP